MKVKQCVTKVSDQSGVQRVCQPLSRDGVANSSLSPAENETAVSKVENNSSRRRFRGNPTQSRDTSCICYLNKWKLKHLLK